MAPEQWSGGVVDGKLDQYALGIVFYQMLAGTPPFQGDSMENLFVQHRDSPMPALPAGLGVPGAVERVIRRATEKTTEARFPSANDMAGPLEGSLSRTPDNLGFCPQCGQPVTRSTSRFCSSCGAELSAPKRLIDDEDRRGEDYVDKEPTGSVTPSQDSATGGEEPARKKRRMPRLQLLRQRFPRAVKARMPVGLLGKTVLLT